MNRIFDEVLPAVIDDRIEVREDDNRCVVAFPTEIAQHIETEFEGYALLERDLGRALNRGPVSDWITERDAQLNDIRTGFRICVQQVERLTRRWVTGCEIRYERRAARGAPVAKARRKNVGQRKYSEILIPYLSGSVVLMIALRALPVAGSTSDKSTVNGSASMAPQLSEMIFTIG